MEKLKSIIKAVLSMLLSTAMGEVKATCLMVTFYFLLGIGIIAGVIWLLTILVQSFCG